MEVLTVIPAKLGSTRLPRKNILPLGGRPLMDWTIKAALDAGCCGTVMVSTESEEIAGLALEAGADVPFMRPDGLGRDPYGVFHVCHHVLEEYGRQGRRFDVLLVLLPTSPFRTAQDIRDAFTLYQESDEPFVASVSRYECDVFCAHSMDSNGTMKPLNQEMFQMRPHLRPDPYEINGAIMVADVKALMEQETLCGYPLRGYVMPGERSVDIDTAMDFEYAKFLLGKGAIDA